MNMVTSEEVRDKNIILITDNMNLKQSILNYEKKKKPRDLLNEVSHYKALSRALAIYIISSSILFSLLLIIYGN